MSLKLPRLRGFFKREHFPLRRSAFFHAPLSSPLSRHTLRRTFFFSQGMTFPPFFWFQKVVPQGE